MDLSDFTPEVREMIVRGLREYVQSIKDAHDFGDFISIDIKTSDMLSSGQFFLMEVESGASSNVDANNTIESDSEASTVLSSSQFFPMEVESGAPSNTNNNVEDFLRDAVIIKSKEESSHYFNDVMKILTLNNVLFAARTASTLLTSYSIATICYSNPVFAAGAVGALGLAACVEYSINGNFKYSTTALGVAAVMSGVLTPLFMNAASAVSTGIGAAIFRDAIFNPNHYSNFIFSGISSCINNNIAYMAASMSAYFFLESAMCQNIFNIAKHQVDATQAELLTQANQEVMQRAEQINHISLCGVSIGWMFKPLTNLLAAQAIHVMRDQTNQGVNVLHGLLDQTSGLMQTSLLDSFEKAGQRLINNITFIPTMLIKGYSKWENQYTHQSREALGSIQL